MLVLIAAPAAALDLAWDANPASDYVTGYTVYWSSADSTEGPFNFSVSGTETTLTLPDSYFKPGIEYEFYATAHNTSGESENSNSVNNTIAVHEVPTDVLPTETYEPPVAPDAYTNV